MLESDLRNVYGWYRLKPIALFKGIVDFISAPEEVNSYVFMSDGFWT